MNNMFGFSSSAKNVSVLSALDLEEESQLDDKMERKGQPKSSPYFFGVGPRDSPQQFRKPAFAMNTHSFVSGQGDIRSSPKPPPPPAVASVNFDDKNEATDIETILDGPVSVFEPDGCSEHLVDKFYLAILIGKLETTRKLLDGGGASVECAGQTTLFVTACWSGNSRPTLLKMLLLTGDSNLLLHDREGRAPRDWTALQSNDKKRLGILSLITTFSQMAASSNIKSAGTTRTLLHKEILGPPPSEIQGTFRKPVTLLRNKLAIFGMTCKGNWEDVGQLGQTRGNGFCQVIYGPEEECAATFLHVPLVTETELGDDPADESCLD